MEATIKNNLKEMYENLKTANPKVRIRDAAEQLQVSEAALVAVQEGTTVLLPQFEELLNEIKTLGPVMALTRNEHAVHERKGKYTKATFTGHIGLVVNPAIDLRLFMQQWKHVFAVQEQGRKSLQFFNAQGEAIHKIYLTAESDVPAYESLLLKYQGDQLADLAIQAAVPATPEKADQEINVLKVQEEWRALKDTHDFFAILRRHGVSRRQSMRIAPEGYTLQLPKEKAEVLLHLAAEAALDIMVFVGNNQCIQIHTGKVEKIVRTGPWINVLDPDFSLHLRDEAIESLWLVKKPTDLGFVHSIEAFDQSGNLIVQFFGKRKANIPEREDWRALLTTLTAGEA